MSKILAIAALAVRGAIRSRIVLLLLGLLLLAVIGVPLTVKSDGTLAGEVQILVRYTLGLSALILSLATVWAGCASISLEMQSRRLHLVATKPVHPVILWLGKWLGLLALNAFLLTVCGMTTAGLLIWRLRAPLHDPARRDLLLDEILVARRKLLPEPVRVENAARQQFEEERAHGALPEQVPPALVLEAIHQTLLTQAFSIAHGGKREWLFPDIGQPGADRPLLCRFKFSSSRPGLEPIVGLWQIRRGDELPHFQRVTESIPMGLHTFTVPLDQVAGSGPLIVEYSNIHPIPLIVVFDPRESLEILIYYGPFAPNFVRALLVILGQLAFLTALGVTAGSLFSMPVAAFVSLFVVLLIQAAGYLQSVAAQPVLFLSHRAARAEAPWWEGPWRILFRVMSRLVRPLHVPAVLENLTSGELVSWATTGRVILTHGILFPLLLALVAAWILRRREIALAE